MYVAMSKDNLPTKHLLQRRHDFRQSFRKLFVKEADLLR
jgi:hypothetical protein